MLFAHLARCRVAPPRPPPADQPPSLSPAQVAEGTFTRNRYAPKHVRLDAEGRYLTWDGGKKGVDLQAVLRISVGLETRTLHNPNPNPNRNRNRNRNRNPNRNPNPDLTRSRSTTSSRPSTGISSWPWS